MKSQTGLATAEKIPIKKDESLFELVQMSHQIQQALVESLGELTPEIEQILSKINERLPDKADGYKFFIDDLKSQADLWNERAANFSRVAKSFTNYVDRLKYTLKMACVELGVEELRGTHFRWKLVNNAPSIVVDDEALVPSQFKEIVQVTKIRTDLLKDTLKSGIEVPGAHIETGSHVRPYPMTKGK